MLVVKRVWWLHGRLDGSRPDETGQVISRSACATVGASTERLSPSNRATGPNWSGKRESDGGRPARGVLRARAVLAGGDPRTRGGAGPRHRLRHRLPVRRGDHLLPAPADR